MEADRRRSCGGDGGVGARPERDVAANGELSDDEKMERFYALIRNYKEARDRLRIEVGRSPVEEDDEIRKRKKKKLEFEDRERPSWIPAFKWEDFTEKSELQSQCSPVILPAAKFSDNSRNMRGDVRDPPLVPPEVDGGGLDLKLRL